MEGWKGRQESGLPVKRSFSQSQDTPSRHESRPAVRKDGTIVAREMSIYLDTGAYADSGPVVCKNLGFTAAGPYRIPNVKVDTYAVYTNKVPAGAMRGFGVPQIAWAYEQQMDMIAEKLGIDPVEMRRLNLLKNGDTFHTGLTMEDVGFDQLLDKVAVGVGWKGEEGTNPEKIKISGQRVFCLPERHGHAFYLERLCEDERRWKCKSAL